MNTASNGRLLSVTEAAERLSVSTSYLNKLRCTGGGPRYVRMGSRIAYDLEDLATWLEAQKRTATSTGAPA